MEPLHRITSSKRHRFLHKRNVREINSYSDKHKISRIMGGDNIFHLIVNPSDEVKEAYELYKAHKQL